MTNSDAVIFGVVSSLLATFLFLILAKIFERIILPWFRQQVYRGVRIDGTWQYTEPLPSPDSQTIQLTFRQSADELRGQQTIVSHVGGQTTTTHYRVSGFISDGRIVAYCRPLDSHSTNYATFYLQFQDTTHGAELRGLGCATGQNGAIVHFPAVFTPHPQ